MLNGVSARNVLYHPRVAPIKILILQIVKMAYYWIPKKWRHVWEDQLPRQARQFIDAGEKVNKYVGNSPAKAARWSLSSWLDASRGRSGAKVLPVGHSSKAPKRYQPPNSSNPAKRRRTKSVPKVSSKKASKSKRKSKTVSKKKPPKKVTMPPKIYPYLGLGHYHGKFKKAKRPVRKVKWPCIVKDERSISSSAAKCLYIGHSSHPAKYVQRMLSMAIVHKYFAQKSIWIGNWGSIAGVQTAIAGATGISLTITAVYQATADVTGDPQYTDVFTSTGSESFLDIADGLANGLLNIVTNSTQDFMLTELQFRSTGVAATNMEFCVWNANDIRISIHGKSMLNIQNRTAAGDASAQTTSIYANPLHGKHYFCVGSGARIRDLGNAVINTSSQLVPDTKTGLVALDIAATPSGLSPQANDALLQPVLPNYFTNCKSSSYIRLEPGSIKQSTCSATVTKSLNGWIKSGYSYMKDATTVAGIGQYRTTGYGVSRIIALEKVADIGSANTIALAGERDAVYMSKLFFRKKKFTVPTNDQI